MLNQFSTLMFSDAVKRIQERYGSRRQYERMAERGHVNGELGPDEREFIRQQDSFYIASQGQNGWPYVQHRGGPKGFLNVLAGMALAFADFGGNKQFLTLGNVSVNDKVTLFLMDYPNRTRLKILGHASYADIAANLELAKRLDKPGYPGRAERIVKIQVVAFDWNCPQHITPRFTEQEFWENS